MIPSVNSPWNFYFALKFSKKPFKILTVRLWFSRKKIKQYTIRDALINKALEFAARRNSLRNLTVTQCTLIATTDMRRGVVPFPSGIHQWTQFDSVFIGVLDGISLDVFYCEQCQEKGNNSLRLWMTPTICVCWCAAQWTRKGNNFLRLSNTTTDTNCRCFDRILTNEHISR